MHEQKLKGVPRLTRAMDKRELSNKGDTYETYTEIAILASFLHHNNICSMMDYASWNIPFLCLVPFQAVRPFSPPRPVPSVLFEVSGAAHTTPDITRGVA